MAVPMNISSHREVGNLIVEIDKGQGEGRTRRLIREKTELQEAKPQANMRQKDYDT